MKKEILFSTDIEANGPIPGDFSMLSLGSAAYTSEKKLLSTFSANFEVLPNAQEDESTMNWWKNQPEAWKEHRKNVEPAEVIMPRFVAWVKNLCEKESAIPVFLAYPSGFDWTFVYWYLIKFAHESPFSFSALDIKSYVMAVLKCGFHESTKRNMPKSWFDKGKHNHVALDDAIEQGALFCNILAANKEGKI